MSQRRISSRFTFSFFLLAAATAVLNLNSHTDAADGDKSNPHLVYIPADKTALNYEALSACDKLTVAEYQKRGVTVTEKTRDDFVKWLETDGKAYEKSRDSFQRVAFAKSLKADAVGKLMTWEITEEDAKQSGMKPGVIIYGWGMGLKALTQSDMILGEPGLEARAVPLGIGGHDSDPWDVPTKVSAQACTNGTSFMAEMPKRAFLGIQIDGQAITKIVPKSPAEALGLKEGDKLISLAGSPISGLDSLRDVMTGKQPGDEIEIEYSHEDKVTKSKIKLADMMAVMEASRPKSGQPVPELAAAKDIEGRDVKLSQFHGKVVLLDFWATWCGPCVNEMPLVNEVAESLKGKDYVWVGVSADDDEKAWKDFVSNNKLVGTHVRSAEWINAMGVQGFPTVMVIDQKGVLRCDSVNGAQIAKSVTAILGEK